MTLRRRIFRAGTWTVASYGVELSTRLLSNLIMTRLLFPDAFGMIAVATAVIAGLQLVSDFGVRTVIIQSPRGEDTDFLRSAWVFQCSRGVILWLVLALVCLTLYVPSIQSLVPRSSLFADPMFPAVAIVTGLTLVSTGLESTALSLSARRLDFRPIFRLEMLTRLVPLPIMIGWAHFMPTVWAIVAGILAGNLARLLMTHYSFPGPAMAFAYQRDHFQEIVAFGKWINLSSFATFVSSQSHTIVLGLLLPGATIGLFYIAQVLSGAVENLLERLNGALTLPVLSEVIREKPTQLKDRYYRFRFPIDIIAAGNAGLLLSAGPLIVRILYDPRYADAGVMLQILSIGLLIYPFQLIRSAFTAVAKANIVAWVSIVQAISLILCLTLGYYFYGTYGAIFGIALNRIIPSATFLYLAQQRNWLSIWGELRWIPAYAAGFLLGHLVNHLLPAFSLADLRFILGR
jgi:O-antigen/teichoic acid export membrane protein